MNDEVIQALWKQGKTKEPKMNQQEIGTILARSVRSGWSELRRMVWFYLAVMGTGLLLVGWDCVTYRSSRVWLPVLGGMMAALLGFIAYGAQVLRHMGRLDAALDSLAESVRRQLCFFRTRYQVWLGMVTAGIWLLTFAVSLQMYHEDGRYRVTVDWLLIAYEVVQVAIIYGLVRGTHHMFSRRLIAALEDLDAQATERTRRIEQGRKWRTALLGLALLLGVTLFVVLLLQFVAR